MKTIKSSSSISSEKQAMLVWRRQYIQNIIDELNPTGNILQVGFDSEETAQYIQDKSPTNLTIIEVNKQRVTKAKKWAKSQSNVNIVEGPWQEVLSSLGVFDSIFFNPYPVYDEVEVAHRTPSKEAASAAEQTNKLVDSCEETLSSISINYSDNDIDSFYNTVGKHKAEELPKLLLSLRNYGFISSEQYDNSVKKYNINLVEESNKKVASEELQFIIQCISKNMHNASSISCYIRDNISRYDDPLFFEGIITNTQVTYKEKVVPVKVKNNPFVNATIMSVTRDF
jgi:hypothetical protein